MRLRDFGVTGGALLLKKKNEFGIIVTFLLHIHSKLLKRVES